MTGRLHELSEKRAATCFMEASGLKQAPRSARFLPSVRDQAAGARRMPNRSRNQIPASNLHVRDPQSLRSPP